MHLTLALAQVSFAQVLLHFDYLPQAIGLINESIPLILTNGDMASQGHAQWVHAQCLLLLPVIPWPQVEACLTDSARCYTAISATEDHAHVLQLLALTYHRQSKFTERNNACRTLKSQGQ